MKHSNEIKSADNKVLSLEKIGIIYNSEHSKAADVIKKLVETLKKLNLSFETHPLNLKEQGDNRKLFRDDITLAVIVGGDGTFLGAARFYAEKGVPLFGINTGRLGFLAQIMSDEIDISFKKLLEGKFKIEERLMLQASVAESNDNQLSLLQESVKSYSALNDIVIRGEPVSRSSRLSLCIDGKKVCDYLADGLIISTPTGSTAYTLSAGGPVVSPDLEVFVVVPICPHALTSRPIVIRADSLLNVAVECDAQYYTLTADGQENIRLQGSSNLSVKRNEKKALIVLPEKENNGFYGILREKLHWGVAPGCKIHDSGIKEQLK